MVRLLWLGANTQGEMLATLVFLPLSSMQTYLEKGLGVGEKHSFTEDYSISVCGQLKTRGEG